MGDLPFETVQSTLHKDPGFAQCGTDGPAVSEFGEKIKALSAYELMDGAPNWDRGTHLCHLIPTPRWNVSNTNHIIPPHLPQTLPSAL